MAKEIKKLTEKQNQISISQHQSAFNSHNNMLDYRHKFSKFLRSVYSTKNNLSYLANLLLKTIFATLAEQFWMAGDNNKGWINCQNNNYEREQIDLKTTQRMYQLWTWHQCLKRKLTSIHLPGDKIVILVM